MAPAQRDDRLARRVELEGAGSAPRLPAFGYRLCAAANDRNARARSWSSLTAIASGELSRQFEFGGNPDAGDSVIAR